MRKGKWIVVDGVKSDEIFVARARGTMPFFPFENRTFSATLCSCPFGPMAALVPADDLP